MKKMRYKKFNKSIYNTVIDTSENGNTTMFNSLSSSIIALDKKSIEVYNDIENIEIEKINDKNILHIINNLESNGFLVEDGLDEYKYYENLHIKTKFAQRSLNLTIALTLDCNMACPYCFETRTDSYMDTELADSIITFIKRYHELSDINELSINWFGGEPLLNVDIIEYLSEKLINYCSNNDIKYTATITTNGVLLNKKNAYILNKYNVKRANLTIDGIKDIHNKRRILKDKRDSFDIILENINECKDILPVVVRINIDKTNIDGVYELFNLLYENKIQFYYKPVLNPNNEKKLQETCYTQDEFSKIDIKLAEYIHENLGNYIDAIYPSIKLISCNGYKPNYFVIDPSGLLYKCNAHLNDPEKSVGNIFEGIVSHSRNTDWISLNIPDKCSTCNKLPICSTPCPLPRFENPNLDLECPYHSLNIEKRVLSYINH
ncbi:MAG: radical SAM protein [Paraclostridium sp.]